MTPARPPTGFAIDPAVGDQGKLDVFQGRSNLTALNVHTCSDPKDHKHFKNLTVMKFLPKRG